MNRAGAILRRNDSGVALLLVLATILIVSTASIAALRVALVGRIESEFDRDAEIAGQICRACEAPIVDFLVSSSSGIVLPTGAEVPKTTVLFDRFVVDGKEIEIRIDGYDAFGMAPFPVLTRGGPLLDLLPNSIREDAEMHREEFQAARALDELIEVTSVSPFPREGDASRDGSASMKNLGAYASFANPIPGELNVNTAPSSYLEAIFAKEKRSGFSKWISARERGERLSAPAALSEAASKSRDEDLPRLVSESVAWHFRIDVKVGRVSRAWWALYEAGSAVEWICSSRVAIP